MSTQREADRKKVLEDVNRSIKQRMDRSSVEEYVEAAEEYAKKYGIEGSVKDWIKEGRTVFTIPGSAEAWAETLP